MSRSRHRRIPPERVCKCGRRHRSWAEHQPCSDCAAAEREHRSALADLSRQQRQERLEEQERVARYGDGVT